MSCFVDEISKICVTVIHIYRLTRVCVTFYSNRGPRYREVWQYEY